MTTPAVTNYLSRDDLGLQPPARPMAPFAPGAVDGIVFHHTTGDTLASPEGEQAWWRAIQSYHVASNGWSDIGYHAAVTRDGAVFGGRDAHWIGAHCKGDGQNSHTVGVAILGNGDLAEVVTEEAIAAAAWVVDLVDYVTGREVAISGHRDHDATHCCGDAFYAALDVLRARAWRSASE